MLLIGDEAKYESEAQFDFRFLEEVDEATKFSRNDNGDLQSFFTNEYCSMCNCKPYFVVNIIFRGWKHANM